MTTVPAAKSQQPLHNFSLPFLKWGQRSHVNTYNRCRRLLSNATTTTTTTNPHRHRRTSDSEDTSESGHNNNRKPNRSHERTIRDKGTTIDDGIGGGERENNGSKVSDVEKPWNLRPRRSSISNIPYPRVNGDGTVHSMKSGRSMRGAAAVAAASTEEEDNKKRRLWISLSKEEIEEDVYAFTGSKPARKAKKRNKTVQKQVDNLFPGLYLVGISADSYRV